MADLAILGLGAMGSRIAARALKARLSVTVYNRNAEAAEPLVALGANLERTPRAAAAGAAVVLATVRDDAASRAIWLDPRDGALGGLARGAVAIESSTLAPAWVEELAAMVGGRGAAFLDAPVVGSRPQAEGGQLVHLIGGEPDVLERVRPLLAAWSAAVHHVGGAGQGTFLKLAVNAVFGIQIAAWAEWLGAAQRAGLDPLKVAEIMGSLPLASPAAKAAAGSMLSGAFAPMFPVELVEKDFGYALTAAGEVTQAPLTAAAREAYLRTLQAGFGGEHLTAVIRNYRPA
jgi:3-hydroxyisobutyrate dehydrogenase-like beta-hydroxyacid dehydrogenase